MPRLIVRQQAPVIMKQVVYFTISLLLITSSCQNGSVSKGSEGVITYAITYPEHIAQKSFSTFLPEKMTFTYKDVNYKLSLAGDLNMYNLEYISLDNGDTCFTLLKLFDKKLYYPLKQDETLFLFQEYNHPIITYQPDSVKVIAGITCQKAVASFKDEEIPQVTIYYTEEIAFEQPNVKTPFEEIPGTMLEFNMFFQGLELTMQAESINLKTIKDADFRVPKTYTQTDADEIKDIVSSLVHL